MYWYTSYDPTGTTALALAVGLCLLTGFYLMFTGRRLPLRPEDDTEAEVSDGTGEIGFFSPHSWWPLFVGAAAAFSEPRPAHAITLTMSIVPGAANRYAKEHAKKQYDRAPWPIGHRTPRTPGVP